MYGELERVKLKTQAQAMNRGVDQGKDRTSKSFSSPFKNGYNEDSFFTNWIPLGSKVIKRLL